MGILGLKSVCRRKLKKPSIPHLKLRRKISQIRDFESSEFGTKWLTDVTEMKYGNQNKAYLSAILDLSDKSIVSFVVGHSNNNELVFKTFDIAHMTYLTLHPLSQ
ncbi:hypothetical protein P7H17_00110 [Paenibacillus larvae]|nr:hypothetical protein [Paenibacillus larvae]MDT2284844.1 hypothetical protein [Paenibacillus larvae]